METAQELIDRALIKGHVVARGVTPDSTLRAAALTTLNDMLEAWRDEGLDLNLGTLALDSNVAADAGAIRAIVYNLAVELANDERVSVPAKTERIADQSRSSLASRLMGSTRVRFPRDLTGGW